MHFESAVKTTLLFINMEYIETVDAIFIILRRLIHVTGYLIKQGTQIKLLGQQGGESSCTGKS